MKQQIITGLKKKLLLVELPEYLKKFTVGDKTVINFGEGIKPNKYYGKPSDLTDEQFSELTHDNGLGCYDNYKGVVDNKYTCLTAKESFFSYLQSKGVVFENKLGSKPVLNYGDYEFGNEGASDSMLESIEADMDSRFEQWQEAESKVWDKERTLLFEIM